MSGLWSKKDTVKQLLLCLGIVMSFSGCDYSHLDYYASTAVAPDGSVTRAVRYVAEKSLEETLRKRYVLSASGKWKDQVFHRYDANNKSVENVPVTTYTLFRKYGPGEPIASDFARVSKNSSRYARNSIHLKIHDLWFAKTFVYRESYTDITTLSEYEYAARKIYDAWLQRLASGLSRATDGRLTRRQARQRLREAFAPEAERFFERFHDQGFSLMNSEAFQKEVGAVMTDEFISARLFKTFTPDWAGQPEAVWQKKIKEVCEGSDDAFTVAMRHPRLEEALWGAYGFYIFEYHHFNNSLILPGQIMDSNADAYKGGALVWKFSADDFRWGEKVLLARSQIVYPEREALIIVLIFMVGIPALIRRRGPKT